MKSRFFHSLFSTGPIPYCKRERWKGGEKWLVWEVRSITLTRNLDSIKHWLGEACYCKHNLYLHDSSQPGLDDAGYFKIFSPWFAETLTQWNIPINQGQVRLIGLVAAFLWPLMFFYRSQFSHSAVLEPFNNFIDSYKLMKNSYGCSVLCN